MNLQSAVGTYRALAAVAAFIPNWCAVISIISFVTGCGALPQLEDTSPSRSNLQLTIDARALPDASTDRNTYLLMPGNDGVYANDPLYQEVARRANDALLERGFTPAATPSTADLAIVLHYGLGDFRRAAREFVLPMTNASSRADGAVPQPSASDATATMEAPTSLRRYVLLTAYDWQQYRGAWKQKVVWKTLLQGGDLQADMRRWLPQMMAASVPFLSQNLQRPVVVEIGTDDADPFDGQAIDAASIR